VTGRHRAARDWWPAVLASGAVCVAGGMWLLVFQFVTGVALYCAGAWLTAAWIGHDITVRLLRRRAYQDVKSAPRDASRR
jgi:hypothetical protein